MLLIFTKACKQLRTCCSGCPDLILNDLFKYGSVSLLSYIHKLFNTLYNRRYFPEALSEDFIIPMHKQGDMNQVENYRGITLLGTIGTLFTRILNDRLNGCADKYDEAQAGFRNNMGTIDNMVVLLGLIQPF